MVAPGWRLRQTGPGLRQKQPQSHPRPGQLALWKALVGAVPSGVGVWAESESVRVTGSGPTKGMPVLSAPRQRGSGSGLGAVTKGTQLCRLPTATGECSTGAEVRRLWAIWLQHRMVATPKWALSVRASAHGPWVSTGSLTHSLIDPDHLMTRRLCFASKQ
eukprot:354601-Chlamydomonas_euryale.AAC.6